MMNLSENPQVAEQQMHAIIFYLTTAGYIDGDFDLSEKKFVRDYIRRVIEWRVTTARIDDARLRTELVEKYTAHFHEVFEGIDKQIADLFDEVVAEGEDPQGFVTAKLKLRCLEIFKAFDDENQKHLLGTVQELIAADGTTHPNERRFCDELEALLCAEIPLHEEDLVKIDPPALAIQPPREIPPAVDNLPFLARLERHYSRDPEVLAQQIEQDLDLLERTGNVFEKQRAIGWGRLEGKQSVAELAGGSPFLDGFVYGLPPQKGREYDITVLGDLHGCYSCLKGALMQSNFVAKVERFRKDPTAPDPKLVFLGDYIDRGMYSYNGILRAAMQLVTTFPDHVYMLRGNHEYYIEYKGKVYGGVRPAEAISTLSDYMPKEVFEAYMRFFETLPNALLFDRTLFVHAGIPRDDTLAEKWQDLSSLNDPDVRFQMLWSDPSQADFVPIELQKQNARFPFGRLQFHAFMSRIGANTMVRGHEKVIEGFKTIYDDGAVLLLNLFSAGGAENEDLPADSSYRAVTPMALTIRWRDGQQTAIPWRINWEAYNSPARNLFFQHPPEIEFKAG
jgi:hypothetical protein